MSHRSGNSKEVAVSIQHKSRARFRVHTSITYTTYLSTQFQSNIKVEQGLEAVRRAGQLGCTLEFQSNIKVEQGLENNSTILRVNTINKFQSNIKVEQGLETAFKMTLKGF